MGQAVLAAWGHDGCADRAVPKPVSVAKTATVKGTLCHGQNEKPRRRLHGAGVSCLAAVRRYAYAPADASAALKVALGRITAFTLALSGW
jgi:hypothetical protein